MISFIFLQVFIILLIVNLVTSTQNYSKIPFEYINYSEENKLMDNPTIKSIFGENEKTNECLKISPQILNELQSQNKTEKDLDDNQKFILGSCNPVAFIAGLYATRLVAMIDCKKFLEKKENLVNLRLFCGNSMCKNGDEYEEHTLWPAIFDSPFQLWTSSDNMYSTCFGHFFSFYKQTDCPTETVTVEDKDGFLKESETYEKTVCLSDSAVRIGFYGATNTTKNDSQCGLRSVRNILEIGKGTVNKLIEPYLNSGATKDFQNFYDKYISLGYSAGFSLAAVPYDFRRFVSTNDLFKNMFEYQINRLYANTGKKVILVTHSLGAVSSLNKLLESDSTLHSKIEKFIAIGPPFAGVLKAVELFIAGTKEFEVAFDFFGKTYFEVGLNILGQKIAAPYIPSGYELRPSHLFSNLAKNKNYKDFIDAILERINLEKVCGNHDCKEESYLNNTSKYSKIFNQFPNLFDKDCLIKDYLNTKSFANLNSYYQKINKQSPNTLPCRMNMYDVIECPSIKLKSNFNEDSSIIETTCSKNSNLTFYAKDCENSNDCLDGFLINMVNYTLIDPRMDEIFNKFNKYYSEALNVTLNPKEYFDTQAKMKEKVKKMIEFHENKSKYLNLTTPPVDTIVIYGNSLPTLNALLYNSTDATINGFSKKDKLYKSGDGTVPNWSSMLVGQKWLFETKAYNLSQKIQLVEYCSPLSINGSKYAFNNQTKTNEFVALDCSCMKNGEYDPKKMDSGECSHSTMVSDFSIINFVVSNSFKEMNQLTSSVKEAFNNYNKTKNFETECNSDMKKIFEDDFL